MDAKDRSEKLFKKVNTFILSCVDENGYPLTKAVVPGKIRQSLNEIYFCTNTSSKFVSAISCNPKACVYFFSRRLIWSGCLLKGTMEIVKDMTIKQKYWQEKFKNAYPLQSFHDPDFCVLRFVPFVGRFYSWYKLEDFVL